METHTQINILNQLSFKVSKADAEFDIMSASNFTLAQLTDIYNETRTDYIVPMPMNQAKLKEYIDNYNINLNHSTVAVAGHEPLGLNMLGIRGTSSWITRLGVVPHGRELGIGRALLVDAIEKSKKLGMKKAILEVIKNNKPAHHLFKKLGFKESRELTIIRRPPKAVNLTTRGAYVKMFGYKKALELLQTRSDIPSWVTDTPSLDNAGNLSALTLNLSNGENGWLVYQNQPFQLSRLVLHTECGDPLQLGTALLQNLHWRHPNQDTTVENLPISDKHLPAFQEMGYMISFRRIEMIKNL